MYIYILSWTDGCDSTYTGSVSTSADDILDSIATHNIFEGVWDVKDSAHREPNYVGPSDAYRWAILEVWQAGKRIDTIRRAPYIIDYLISGTATVYPAR